MYNRVTVLIIEDENSICDFISKTLRAHQYKCIQASTGKEGISLITSRMPDVILLDLGLPDMDGMEVLQNVRGWSSVPVIVISARNQEREKVTALDAGADDYITKPFGTSELLARIRTALRHSNKLNTDSINSLRPYHAGNLMIDFEKRRVFLENQDVHLTQVEYKIVSLLARNAGKVMTYDSIISDIWGPFADDNNRILRVNMANIRRKIEKNPGEPEYIFTELGVGYRMLEDEKISQLEENGMADLKKLVTESVNQDTVTIDECSTEGMLRMINREDQKVALAVEQEIPQITKAVDMLYPALKNGGRMFYVGAGTSGRLGVLDASECPPTYGTDPELVQGYIAGGDVALRSAVEGCEDDEQAGRDLIDQCKVTDKDVVIGITASGSAAFVIGALKKAREIGAGTIGVTNNKQNDFDTYCDVCIAPVCGPEVISGSTRMKSGTSQKLVLNMLTTSVMVKLGKVYQNRMVDLRASNKKLHNRSVRMIGEITGTDAENAEAWLKKAGGSTKLAIMCILAGCEVDEARKLLEQNDGYLKSALKSIEKNEIK